MDNLELMKQIEDNSVDLIYSDILYGTGRDFGDYQDLKADRKVIENFYINRIKKMRRILKDTGSIYIQCDYRINHWIRCILDDVFGYEQFRNEIIWERTKVNKNTKNKFPDNTDKILFYAKSKDNKFNKPSEVTEILPYDIKLRKSGSASTRIDRPTMWYPFYYDVENDILSVDKKSDDYIEIFPIDAKGIERRWEWGKAKSEKDINLLFVKEINNRYDIFRKSKDNKVVNISNIWDMSLDSNMEYQTQKPKSLLKRIIETSSDENDIVADFFCGSGTAGVVAKELNRKYILCDINERAIEISKDRLNKTNEVI